MNSTTWHREIDESSTTFSTLDSTLAIDGEAITRSDFSYLLRAQLDEGVFYIKVYSKAGKFLRRFLGRSRLRGEWENLLFFQSLGISTAPVIAYGEERRWGMFNRGILVTAEVRGAIDLEKMSQSTQRLSNVACRRHIMNRIADIAATLHSAGFIHNDLKWRNILIGPESEPRVYLIDCPVGRVMFGPLRSRGITKDLACLDKVGRRVLSRTDRLRFYQAYRKTTTLSEGDKQRIGNVLGFFKGRE